MVRLSGGLLTKVWMNFREILQSAVPWDKEQFVRIWGDLYS